MRIKLFTDEMFPMQILIASAIGSLCGILATVTIPVIGHPDSELAGLLAHSTSYGLLLALPLLIIMAVILSLFMTIQFTLFYMGCIRLVGKWMTKRPASLKLFALLATGTLATMVCCANWTKIFIGTQNVWQSPFPVYYIPAAVCLTAIEILCWQFARRKVGEIP